MDPEARRFMWQVIADTMNGRSVILTTHTMEEAEALSHRIGIMVRAHDPAALIQQTAQSPNPAVETMWDSGWRKIAVPRDQSTSQGQIRQRLFTRTKISNS